MKSRNYLLAVVIILTAACKNDVSLPEPAGDAKYTPKKLMDAEWILGNWEDKDDKGSTVENWTKKTDSSFVGESIVMEGKDVVFREDIQLIQRKDSLFYMVTIAEENDGKPVSFYATKATASQLVFENPKHDFPKKIAYSKINNDSIVASIYGSVGSGESFPLKRKK